MKKLLSILLLLLYINAAWGIGVDIHFCQGRIADVKLFGFGKAHCSCPEGPMPDGCCRNESHFFKSDTHKAQVDATLLPPVPAAKEVMPWNHFRLILPATTGLIRPFHFYHFTKLKPCRTLLTLHQVFRI